MIDRGIRGLARALAALAGLSVVLMMLQMVADVVLTHLAGAPIEGNLEVVSVYHMVAVVFLPLAIVEIRHEHINVDLLVQLFPRWLQVACYVLGCLLSAVFFAILGWQTLLDAIRAYQVNEVMMGASFVTIWPARFLLPIGFFAILLAVLLHAWRALTDPTFHPVPAAPDAREG